MQIIVTKLTDESLMRKACAYTIGRESSMTLDKIYRAEHSPMRTQIFTVEMIDIPTFVSVHLVRHNQGVTHFVKSNRDDRCGNGTETRETPVNHLMLINAQALINMARKRLCYKAHPKTVAVMRAIRLSVWEEDPALADYMVPECEYRNGCNELKSCGYFKKVSNG